jgi:hypothetical protein
MPRALFHKEIRIVAFKRCWLMMKQLCVKLYAQIYFKEEIIFIQLMTFKSLKFPCSLRHVGIIVGV